MHRRSLSYWERDLPTESPQLSLPAHSDIVIVGAGLMGSWLAYWMTRIHPKRSVIVLEADHFGCGASTRNAGFLTAGHISEYMEDTVKSGLEEVIEQFLARRQGIRLLREEFPDLLLDRCGSVDLDDIDDDKRDLAHRLNQAAGETVFEERDIFFDGKEKTVHFSVGDAGLNPVELLQSLQRDSHVQFFFRRRVDGIGGGIASVDKEALRYGRAFVCINAFASDLDPNSKVEPGRGQIIVTSPVETSTTKVLGFIDRGYDYFRFVDGRLLVGGGRHIGGDSEKTSEFSTTPTVRDYLSKVAERIIGHQNWKIDHHWAGIMGFVGGKHIGGSQRQPLDSQTEIVAGFGGMGVALTPTIARTIASSL